MKSETWKRLIRAQEGERTSASSSVRAPPSQDPDYPSARRGGLPRTRQETPQAGRASQPGQAREPAQGSPASSPGPLTAEAETKAARRKRTSLGPAWACVILTLPSPRRCGVAGGRALGGGCGGGRPGGRASPSLIRTSSQPSHLECGWDPEAAPGPPPHGGLREGPPRSLVCGGRGKARILDSRS